ncbi:MAG: prolipoprotein diacylglyceryl transferase [Candidatus Melainabacteria bacterium]|nr:prolipoprotein diacylglyceryl transferase [Candidatus Melainabacteria bacterium]
MILESPGAILCQIGPFPVRYYGMMIGLGFVIALFFAGKLAKKMALSADTLVSLALYSFIFGIVGARLYYVLLSLGHFIHHPLQIFATWNGGLAIHGGIIGGVIAGCLYLRSKKLPILPYADVMGACIPLAQALGRWGNFFNSELYGLPVAENFPLKLHIPIEYRLPQYQAYEYFHPTFLYESVWDFLIFLFLYFYFIKKNKDAPGMTFFMYLAAYSIGRIFIEQLRIDAVSYVFNVPTPILASAATLVFSLCAMLNIYNRAQRAQALSQPPEAEN